MQESALYKIETLCIVRNAVIKLFHEYSTMTSECKYKFLEKESR